ncbi:MAG: hypothetical protein COX37_00765 [Candidatus Nealsonbacteria bacterium CG23_combo_of_CG06-09_8_20_14_all_39_17]|uniref:DNA polymerase III subunit delta n=1 Tax=Candidatus Nealsonbacteria bacterium CG23_combo_of_CG06-09_8_20_14_all_39_17 TaxID=1974722 RepID=A0A2G9YUX7_9BACT|nr:MAG: hypothetical protein COX37_00765 [Candidatus Nealsonbacteria bacterium CG23_combo_of_CG06-09_8_20_14_all_39_17]PIU44214.1 MAG: hypothetical protein COS96_00140 [Candidatus Nealsonbacteria bacterium CG07_land_8_20_14_0_80_39_13]
MLIGHKKQQDFLERIIASGNIPHALMFVGQEKLGKRTLALEFAKKLLGNDSSGQYPDLILIEPEGKDIQISQIRELSRKLSLKPYFSSFKVAIINDASSMNSQAQHSFLKTLEEPKGKTVLILVAESLNLFFPTIASRCEMIKFYPVTKGEIKDFLKTQELSAEEIEDIIKLSAGRPGEAVDLAVDKSKLEKHRQAIEELKDILNSNLGSRFRYVKDLDKEKEEEGAIDAKGILNVWLGFFRDMLLFELEYPEKKNSFGYSVPKIEDIIKKTQEIIFLTSSTNANKKLALETLMLEF